MVEVKAMTTAEYLALPPRERDALVAEKLCGWTWDEQTARQHGESPCSRIESDPWWWLPEYNTSRANMWLVIDAMRERGFHCQLSIAEDGSTRATFTDMRGADTTGLRYMRLQDTEQIYRFAYALASDELPLAASIAALRAVGWLVD